MHQLVQAQVALGAAVRVITTDADGRTRLQLRRASWGGAEVEYFPARPLNSYGVSLGLWRAVVGLVREHDIVHMHGVFLPSTTVGLWSAQVAGTPTVVSPRGALMSWAVAQRACRKRIYGLVDRRPLMRSLVHATAENEATDLRKMGLPNVVVVPNGVDNQYLGQPNTLDVRRHLGIREDGPIVTWIGRFSEVKNLEVLIDATRDLGVTLVLAGDHSTPYGRRISERVRAQARGDVYFAGYADDELKRALLQQSSVYAHPSIMESYGLSIVEALAAGCPVAASTGTPWAVVEDRGAGRWVPPNVGAFREAIASLLTRPRPELHRAALLLASEHGWSRRAKEMLDAYQSFRSGRSV
jgi:glycosyltransferase involved in cell wall biosynthesis